MSLMSLGYKITAIQNEIKEGRFTSTEQVKAAAEEMNVAATIGYENLCSEEKDMWYKQLAVNLFEKHNNWIPCFADIGFGRELLDHMSNMMNMTMPKKQHWKFSVTRSGYSDWIFNAVVCTYTKEEAVCILKNYFCDFGGLGFYYDEPTAKTENKAKWVEINGKKPGSYKKYLESNRE